MTINELLKFETKMFYCALRYELYSPIILTDSNIFYSYQFTGKNMLNEGLHFGYSQSTILSKYW